MTESAPAERNRRDAALEALRGLASVSVLFWHNILGFFPQRSGIYPGQDLSKAFVSRFWFGLVYGTSAVAFFFVLSGFVLTRRFFLSGDVTSIQRNAIKRWPRLAMPVLVTVLASWACLRFQLYSHQPAAIITQSWWLWYFGNASNTPIVPDFLFALRLGTLLTFFHGDSLYDSSLWTMRFEFVGSFVVMGLALLVRQTPTRALKIYLIFVVMAVCHYTDPQYVAFPVGMSLAAFLPDAKRMTPRWLTAGTVVFAIYCLGYTGLAVGAFRPLAWLVPSAVPSAYVNVLGSVLLIVAAETSQSLHSWLSARWAVFLGRLSFPLYLVHVPVTCSVGSAVLIKVNPRLGAPNAELVAAAAAMVASFAIAYPLTVLNERWLVRLNKIVERVLPRGDALGSASRTASS